MNTRRDTGFALPWVYAPRGTKTSRIPALEPAHAGCFSTVHGHGWGRDNRVCGGMSSREGGNSSN